MTKIDRENVIEGLEAMREFFGFSLPSQATVFEAYRNILTDAIVILKEQEESIPVSWLTEKLEGHPELSYAVTDGINNVLDLWEGR